MNWCKKGEFRQDLYHRIFVFPIALPPLRERSEDIRLLVDFFARAVAEQNDWKPREITPEAYAELERYSWPGNVRELRNVVERLLLLADDRVDLATVRQALPMAEQATVSSGTCRAETCRNAWMRTNARSSWPS